MARFGYYDTETTGTDVKNDRIIEAALIIRDENGIDLDRFNKRINPQMKISPGAMRVHGIADADVAFEPTLEAIGPELFRRLESCDLIVMHNGDEFDYPLTRNEAARIGYPLKLPPSIDTMQLGRTCTPDGKVPTLRELCWALDVPYDTTLSHSAIYDITVMADAFTNGNRYGIWG